MCGFQNSTQYLNQDFLANGITLVALSYHSPLTLANSMRTWNDSGLLDLMQERVAILSRPSLEEVRFSVKIILLVVKYRSVVDNHLFYGFHRFICLKHLGFT